MIDLQILKEYKIKKNIYELGNYKNVSNYLDNIISGIDIFDKNTFFSLIHKKEQDFFLKYNLDAVKNSSKIKDEEYNHIQLFRGQNFIKLLYSMEKSDTSYIDCVEIFKYINKFIEIKDGSFVFQNFFLKNKNRPSALSNNSLTYFQLLNFYEKFFLPKVPMEKNEIDDLTNILQPIKPIISSMIGFQNDNLHRDVFKPLFYVNKKLNYLFLKLTKNNPQNYDEISDTLIKYLKMVFNYSFVGFSNINQNFTQFKIIYNDFKSHNNLEIKNNFRNLIYFYKQTKKMFYINDDIQLKNKFHENFDFILLKLIYSFTPTKSTAHEYTYLKEFINENINSIFNLLISLKEDVNLNCQKNVNNKLIYNSNKENYLFILSKNLNDNNNFIFKKILDNNIIKLKQIQDYQNNEPFFYVEINKNYNFYNQSFIKENIFALTYKLDINGFNYIKEYFKKNEDIDNQIIHDFVFFYFSNLQNNKDILNDDLYKYIKSTFKDIFLHNLLKFSISNNVKTTENTLLKFLINELLENYKYINKTLKLNIDNVILSLFNKYERYHSLLEDEVKNDFGILKLIKKANFLKIYNNENYIFQEKNNNDKTMFTLLCDIYKFSLFEENVFLDLSFINNKSENLSNEDFKKHTLNSLAKIISEFYYTKEFYKDFMEKIFKQKTEYKYTVLINVILNSQNINNKLGYKLAVKQLIHEIDIDIIVFKEKLLDFHNKNILNNNENPLIKYTLTYLNDILTVKNKNRISL